MGGSSVSDAMNGWGEWRTKIKKAHPIQFFFRESVPDFFHGIIFRLRMIKWWVLHRTTHRYHVIKPRSLEPGYHDPDTRIRAAAFDIMSEHAEISLMGDGIKGTKWTEEDLEHYPEDDGQRQMVLDQIEYESKIIELRNWWVEYRPRRENTRDDMLMDIDFDADDKDEKLQKLWKFEEGCSIEDEQKFIELVKLVPHMWS